MLDVLILEEQRGVLQGDGDAVVGRHVPDFGGPGLGDERELVLHLVDDLLDVQGDEAKLGKRVGKDDGLGKWTYPRFLGIEGSRDRARQLADEAVAVIQPFGERGRWLRDLALALLERDR